MDDDKVSLFISHPWRSQHRRHTQDLLSLLKRAKVNYENTAVRSLDPVRSENEAYLRSKIRDRLRSSDALVFVAGGWVRHSEWMQFEIAEALRLKKPVIAIRRHGAARLTYEETELGVEAIRWSTRSLAARLKEKEHASAAAAIARSDARIVEPILPRQRRGFWSRLFGR